MKAETMRMLIVSAIATLCLVLQGCESAPLTQSEKQEKRAEVRNMANQSLEQLYAAHPGARYAVKNAAGYAVFSNFGFKLIFGGSEKGNGIAINNATKQETFMKMFEIQPGCRFRSIQV